jgi:LacI family transcriptional regulator
MNRPPTLRELARAAGVHHSTVSRALRNAPSIPEETRKRLWRLAEKLGYKSNPLVSAWMTHRKRVAGRPISAALGYLICFRELVLWRRNPSTYRYYIGAKRRAMELGYSLDRFWLGEPGMTPQRMNEILKARNIRGIIVGSATVSHAHLSLDWNAFAAVAQGFSLRHPNLSRTANNYSRSMNLALRHVRRLGYRRIGHVISHAVDSRIDRLSTSAFLYYQQLIPRGDRVPNLFWHTEEPDVLKKWFERHRPEAIVSHNLEARTRLESWGISVPDDVGFAAFDWHPHMRQWAGVDHRLEEAGRAAVDLLVEQLMSNTRGVPECPRMVLTEGKWMDGKSLRKRAEVAPLLRLHADTRLIHYTDAPEYLDDF